MRQSHLIISNAAIIWTAQILQLFPQIILVPFLISSIGEDGYGIYALVWSLLAAIDQMERSLQSGVVKYSAGFLARGRLRELNRVVSSSFIFSIGLAVLACAIIFGVAAVFEDHTARMGSAMAVIGVMVLFIIPLTPYIAVIQAKQRYYVEAIAGTVSKYAGLFAVVAWFHMVRPSVGALIVIMAGTLFLARLAQVPVAYRLIPGLQNQPALLDRSTLKLIVSFGAATVLASLCLAVNSTGVRWLMNSLASTVFVAHMAIMLMPGLLLTQIVGAMTLTAMPAASAYEATGDQRMLQELLVRGMRYSAILVLAGLLAAIILMESVLKAWVGPDYLFLTPYAVGLFTGTAFMQSTSISHHMLKGLGKLRVVVAIYVAGLVVVPVGSILGIFQVWGNPYIAVTAGLAAGHLVTGVLQAVFCARAVQARLSRIFVVVYAQPLLIAGPLLLAVSGLLTFAGFDGLIVRSLASVIAVLFFFAGCYLFIATTAERQQAAGLVRSASNRIAGFM